MDAPHRLLNEIQRMLEGRPANSLLGGAFAEEDGAWEQAVTALDTAIAAKLPEGREWEQRKLANTIVEASRTQGRAVAYSLAAHGIEVLAQDAADRMAREGTSGPEPVAFLRGIISRLAQQLTDSALLRDIAALLEQRLPSETMAERALLEAAARRAESPDDPAALERVDPDIATVLERMFGADSQSDAKARPRRGKRSGGPRRGK